MEVGNITKAANFKSFSSPKLQKNKVAFFMALFLNIFMRKTLTDYFGQLHENVSCSFLLKRSNFSCMG